MSFPILDRFERAVILRTSRGLFLLVAIAATLGLAGGGAGLAWSLTPTTRGVDPPEPTAPAPPEVTLADVLGVLDAPEQIGRAHV